MKFMIAVVLTLAGSAFAVGMHCTKPNKGIDDYCAEADSDCD